MSNFNQDYLAKRQLKKVLPVGFYWQVWEFHM